VSKIYLLLDWKPLGHAWAPKEDKSLHLRALAMMSVMGLLASQRVFHRKSICLVLSMQGLHCKTDGLKMQQFLFCSRACNTQEGTCKQALDA